MEGFLLLSGMFNQNQTIMKLLYLFAIVFLCITCSTPKDEVTPDPPCTGSTWPTAPYSSPDDKTTYIDGGYRSIDYIWYCRGGKYVSITFTQVDYCENWKRSDYTSSGICN